jgi:(S)-sulfolactate dehydrogenase
MQVIISEFMDEDAVQSLAAKFDVRYEPDLVDRRADLLAAMSQADAIIVRNRTQVDAALLAASPNLKVVGRLGVGLDNIDVDQCDARAIDVIPAVGANARAVAEYVIASALLLLRGAYGISGAVANGTWPRNAYSNGLEAENRVMGIVGFGGIGRLTGKLAAGIDMRVVGHDPMLAPDHPAWREHGVEPLSLADLLARSDVVSLHIPLTAQTRNLIDATKIAGMKDGAIVINTARGGVIDEAALADALRSGKLRGAAIDVFTAEPLPGGSALADAPNVILTPHIAGLTQEANVRVSSLVADRVAASLGA